MYLGMYYPEKNAIPLLCLEDAINRYREKFGSEPDLCLTAPAHAEALATNTLLPVRGVSFIGKGTYYVGKEDTDDHE